MTRIVGLIPAMAALLSQVVHADEIRRTVLPAAIAGTWASNPQFCASKDKSNIVIGKAEYHAAGANCTVDWVVETAGATGPNYAVHASCADPAQPTVKRVENLIMRPQGADRITVGSSFDDQKLYQRCADAQ